jgi:hypothetical protein
MHTLIQCTSRSTKSDTASNTQSASRMYPHPRSMPVLGYFTGEQDALIYSNTAAARFGHAE